MANVTWIICNINSSDFFFRRPVDASPSIYSAHRRSMKRKKRLEDRQKSFRNYSGQFFPRVNIGHQRSPGADPDGPGGGEGPLVGPRQSLPTPKMVFFFRMSVTLFWECAKIKMK